MTLFKKIVVTEGNYKEVLDRLQKTCNKYYMLSKRISRNNNGDKTIVKTFLSIKRSFHEGKIQHRISFNKEFLFVEEHAYHSGELQRPNFMVEYSNPIIRVEDSTCVFTIDDGTNIRFLPFGGFIVYNDSSWMGDNNIKYYTDIYIPYFCKIKNLEEEIEKRQIEQEEIECSFTDDSIELYEQREDDEEDYYYEY